MSSALGAVSGIEVVKLASGRRVSITKFCYEFIQWEGPPIADTYGGKAALDCGGEPLFAELAISRRFQRHGWEGVWVDSYRRKYRTGLPGLTDPVGLPADKERLIQSIRRKAGKLGGAGM